MELEFTGERLIPIINKGAAFYYEHLARYLFSMQFVKHKSVLDTGSGAGYGSHLLSKYGNAKKVYGIDIDRKSVLYASEKYKNKGVTFAIDDVTKLKTIKNSSIDVAVCFEVIEHIINQQELLKQITRVLKKDGIFVVSSPNKLTYPTGNPYHQKELHPRQFKKLLDTFFPHVVILHQSFVLSDMIGIIRRPDLVLEEKFTHSEEDRYSHSLNPQHSEYLLAVCSRSKLPAIREISLSSTSVDGIDLSKGMLSLSKQFFVNHKEVNQLKDDNKRLQEELSIITSSAFFKLWPAYVLAKKLFKKIV